MKTDVMHAPDLGGEWKCGCPKSPMWQSEGEAWSEDKSASSSDSREDNVCNDALHVIGLYGPGDKVSLALSCHMALDMLCQEMHEAWYLVCDCQMSLRVAEGRRNVSDKPCYDEPVCQSPSNLMFKHGVPVERGCPFFLLCHFVLCILQKVESRRVPPFEGFEAELVDSG